MRRNRAAIEQIKVYHRGFRLRRKILQTDSWPEVAQFRIGMLRRRAGRRATPKGDAKTLNTRKIIIPAASSSELRTETWMDHPRADPLRLPADSAAVRFSVHLGGGVGLFNLAGVSAAGQSAWWATYDRRVADVAGDVLRHPAPIHPGRRYIGRQRQRRNGDGTPLNRCRTT